jgi:hypothetical protein
MTIVWVTKDLGEVGHIPYCLYEARYIAVAGVKMICVLAVVYCWSSWVAEDFEKWYLLVLVESCIVHGMGVEFGLVLENHPVEISKPT